jgi:tetratricopeptide (TPR) repeat protein
MHRRRLAWLAPLGALMFGTAPAAAQRGQQPQETQQPQCRSLSIRGSSRLDAALQALDRAGQAASPEVRRRYLGDAVRALGEAVRDGRGDPLTVWHFFGQAYALQGDLAGADSAFRRAEALADPECVSEIARRRRVEWAPFVRDGSAQSQAGNVDSALALFRRANTIYRAAPFTFISMGNIFLNRTQTDSAIVYFRLAGRSSDEADYFAYRWRALLNVAHLLVRENRLSEADSAFREYLRLRPYDLSAQATLAGVLQQSNRPAEAQAVYD